MPGSTARVSKKAVRKLRARDRFQVARSMSANSAKGSGLPCMAQTAGDGHADTRFTACAADQRYILLENHFAKSCDHKYGCNLTIKPDQTNTCVFCDHKIACAEIRTRCST